MSRHGYDVLGYSRDHVTGVATWRLSNGDVVTCDAPMLTVTRPRGEPLRVRLQGSETMRAGYHRALELDGLSSARPLVHDDYSAVVTVEAEIAGQAVTVRVACQLRRGAPEVLYATSAEVVSAGEGPLVLGDVVEVSEAMIADVEAVLVDAWVDLEAA